MASLKATIKESGIKDIIIIADKGFYSEANTSLLEKNNLKYIFPIKRNSTLIDFKILKEGTKNGFKGYFKFKDRFISYYRCSSKVPVSVYLDDELRVKDQKDYLERIETPPVTLSIFSPMILGGFASKATEANLVICIRLAL